MIFSKGRYKNSCFKVSMQTTRFERFLDVMSELKAFFQMISFVIDSCALLIFSQEYFNCLFCLIKKSKFLGKSASIPPVQKQSPQVIGKERIL